ncbi:MAG: PepSY domain-containing protein [Sphingomonadales bacterium]|nr:PepSY domain-containing protein [Sphingomonadales bacterium]
MSVLHGWTGLIPGWVVFIVFLFGTLAFFQQEISSWMRPEIGRGVLTQATLEKASHILEAEVPARAAWSLSLPVARGGEPLELSWRSGPQGREFRETLDPATGRPITVRETLGGGFLFSFHYNFHYMPGRIANYLVCIASLAMLLSIISGVITHKRIFKDYFTLRLDKGQRSWLDGHNVMAVLALPFHLMITYTGLVTLVFLIMPWAVLTGFPDSEAFRQEFRPRSPAIEVRSDQVAAAAPLRIVSEARAINGELPRYVATHDEDGGSGVIEAWPGLDRLGASYDTIFFRRDGTLIEPATAAGGASKTMGVMVDLHSGRFSGYLLRWLYFFSGLVGTAMVATGLILWVKKRRVNSAAAGRAAAGLWLAERLNIGVIAGSVAGVAAFFLANRLLPVRLSDRGEQEVAWLFTTWGVVFLWSLVSAPKRGWIVALAFGALLYVLVPLVNAVTTARGLFPSLVAGDWVFAGFDLSMLATSAVLALVAWHLYRRPEDDGRAKRASKAR